MQQGMAESLGHHAFHPASKAVGDHVGLRRLDRHRVDVRGKDHPRQHLGRRHRQDGGAAADVGHAMRRLAVRNHAVQRQQAAARRVVVAGAEGHGGLDAERLGPVRHLVGIMGAVDEEASGLDRGQLAPDMGHPVHLGQFRDGEGLRAMGRRQQRQRDLVGAFGEIDTNLPAVRAVLDLEDAAADGLGGQVLAVLGQGLGGLAALKVRQRGPGRHQAAPPAATELPPVDEGEGSGLPSISPVAASCSALACDACTPVPRRAQ